MSRVLIHSSSPLRQNSVSGGANLLMKNLARALDESGWDVDILSPQSSSEEFDNEERINYIEFTYGDPESSTETMINTVRGVSTYRDTIAKSEYDIILDNISHFPYYPAHFLCPKGATNAVFMHTAFFGAARGYVGPVRGTVIDIIDRSLPYLNTPEIVCAGSETARRIHEKTGYTKTRILHPCVHTNNFEYNFSPDSNTILYLGRLGERKNASCLLRAWGIISKQVDHDLKLVIAGTGPKERELHALANRLSLSNIEFRGYVSEAEKQRLFMSSLLYIIPSKMEGYVTTGIEALASGTPVVGSNTVGINDYIEHGKTGYLFPIDDHESLAHQIIRLTRNPEQMRPVAERGRELAMDHTYSEFKKKANELFTSMA